MVKKDNKTIEMTARGVESLKKELSGLKDKLPVAIKRLAQAREKGDLSENSEYNYAREDLEFLENKIDEIKDVLAKVKVVSGKNSGKIGIGSKVEVEIDGEKETYLMVNEFEANPTKRKISDKSPLGVFLLGKKAGEKGVVDLPGGKLKLEILKVS